MPWTFAHPAAVLPLRRFCPKYLSLVALIVGSITPDLGYYVSQFRAASYAHTFSGSLFLCLPSGFAMLAILFLMRKPILFLLPQPHRSALTGLSDISGRLTVSRTAVIAYSLVLGAWTHIVWDSFTHNGTWGARHIALLREPLFHVGATAFHGYRVLQHLSTVIGVAALAAAYWVWLRQNRAAATALWTQEEQKRWGFIAVAAGTAIVAAIPVALSLAASESGFRAFGVFAYHATIISTAIFIPSFLALALFHYVSRDAADDSQR